MPVEGIFTINDAHWSPLKIMGAGIFMAFSGQGGYRNHGGCVHISNLGPIPPGKYWIVDRAMGGKLNQLKNYVKDLWTGNNHDEWFALYHDDNQIDDYTWIKGVERGHFRLHPGRISEGCITLPYYSDFQRIRQSLLSTSKIWVPGMAGLQSYGTIEVIANGTTCP
ncbi:DUF2778 domain-containing protein [Pantoea wallisii]|uniref:DUF2778 domain-containing protein n=1 Tax=Pantoea wallisii TaxID=1076551 RepID=UPI000FFBEBE3|nr:DUF2778 domain-containing protein [Pantoea wallisii]